MNAMALAKYLDAHERVGWVSYLGLPSHPSHENARKFLHGFGSVLSFGVKGGRGSFVAKSLKLHSSLPNFGAVHSLVSFELTFSAHTKKPWTPGHTPGINHALEAIGTR